MSTSTAPPPANIRSGARHFRSKDMGLLLLRCTNRPGLVAAASMFLADAGANVVSLDQRSTQYAGGKFMQRTIFHLPGLVAARDALERDFAEQFAAPFGMDSRLAEVAKPKRVAIIVSTDDHCLLDPAVAQPSRRVGHFGGDGDRQPSRPRRRGTPVQGALHFHAGTQGDSGRSQTAPARPAARKRRSE